MFSSKILLSLVVLFRNVLDVALAQGGIGFGVTCSAVGGSLTCEDCPACMNASCASSPIPLPPKSPFWPPEDILQRPFGADPIPANLEAEYEWFESTVLDVLPQMVEQADTKYALTPTEEALVTMSLVDWQAARAAGTYACEEIATAMIKRAMYLQDIQKMNHFMYWNDILEDEVVVTSKQGDLSLGSFNWTNVVMEQAKALDAKAEADGADAIAPMYCYPIPAKGTMSTTDFPSSSGFAALHGKFALVDAALITLVKEANGVVFGKTNVPELAHSYGTGNYANGICFNPWGYDYMTGGSSGGSGAAVAAYTAAIAITEDTGGSTNTPAVRNHLFGYDPPKFHYPNAGNPSLSYRNDQLGLNARSIEDIIAFDMAVLGTAEEHAAAKAKVDAMENSDIVIGCSDVYYNYSTPTEAIKNKFNEAKQALMDAGFSFVEECHDVNPHEAVPDPEGTSRSAFWYSELADFMFDTLGLTDLTPWDVLLNGFYDFGTSLSMGWMFGNQMNEGCDLINKNTEEAKAAYLGEIPANRSNVYNEYFDGKGVDLIMGPGQYCDKVLWTEDIGGSVGINAGCDGGRTLTRCMSNCMPPGIKGTYDKTFTKAKFVVPIGLTEVEEPIAIQFMSRAGPKDYDVPAIEWVYDEEGPKTWNLEEIYMVQRISQVLEGAGMGRADAPFNEEVTGLNLAAEAPGSTETEDAPASSETEGTDESSNAIGVFQVWVPPVAVMLALAALF